MVAKQTRAAGRSEQAQSRFPRLQVRRIRKNSETGAALLFFVLGLACSSAPTRPDVADSRRVTKRIKIRPLTRIPTKISKAPALPKAAEFVLTTDVVERAAVSRPRAEVRDGPGSQFPLQNAILIAGEPVVVVDRYKRWNKIYAYNRSMTGWVHEQTLSSADSDQEKPKRRRYLKLKAAHLPRVIAVNSIDFIQRFSDNERIKLPLRIKRGFQFVSLKRDRGRVLVWLSDTNSVAWLSAASVK